MKKKNSIANVNRIKNNLEKEIEQEYSDTIKEMVKAKMKTIKLNNIKIQKIKEKNDEIEKDIDDILKGKKHITEQDLIEYKGNQDYDVTTYI